MKKKNKKKKWIIGIITVCGIAGAITYFYNKKGVEVSKKDHKLTPTGHEIKIRQQGRTDNNNKQNYSK